VINGVFDLEDVARAAWGLALFWLDNLDVNGARDAETRQFLENARDEILPG
jgi:hypothetical protein